MRLYLSLQLGLLWSVLRSRNDLLMENLVLRQQPRPRRLTARRGPHAAWTANPARTPPTALALDEHASAVGDHGDGFCSNSPPVEVAEGERTSEPAGDRPVVCHR